RGGVGRVGDRGRQRGGRPPPVSEGKEGKMRTYTGEHAKEKVDETNREAQGMNDEWEPLPLGQQALPPFPVDALPGWLGAFVTGTSRETQTPADLAAIMVLSALAVAVQKKVDVRVRGRWVEPLSLYTATAMKSGTRKSEVVRRVSAPVEQY